jgi:hypothetical protein
MRGEIMERYIFDKHYTVDQQMLAIVLIWRVGKNHQIKMMPSSSVSP